MRSPAVSVAGSLRPVAPAMAERPGAGREAGQGHDALVDDAGDLRRIGRRAPAFGEMLELAPGHGHGRGHRPAEGIDISEAAAGRIESLEAAAGGKGDHPGAGGDDGEGQRPRQDMRQEARIAVMDADDDAAAFVQARRSGDVRQHAPGLVPGREPLGDAGGPALADGERRAGAGSRVPEIAMGAERGRLGHPSPGQPPDPVLRIGQDGPRRRKRVRKGAGEPVELAPGIEAAPGRSGDRISEKAPRTWR